MGQNGSDSDTESTEVGTELGVAHQTHDIKLLLLCDLPALFAEGDVIEFCK